MTFTESLSFFRSEMNDATEPYLWSDTDVLSYMDDAQKMFCRLTEGLEDARTASVTQLDLVPDTEWYDLSPLILKIRSSYRTDTGRPVLTGNLEHLEELGIRFDGRTGVLKALIQGESKNQIRAYPIPIETVTVQLSVFRLPLLPIDTESDLDASFEIDAQHHRHLLLWMKHLAYDKQDAETIDRTKSKEFEARFRAYCADARVEQGRARRVGRAVSYGGI